MEVTSQGRRDLLPIPRFSLEKNLLWSSLLLYMTAELLFIKNFFTRTSERLGTSNLTEKGIKTLKSQQYLTVSCNMFIL